MMKKILFIVCILYMSINAFAQRRTGPQIIRGGLIKIGLHSGPSFLVNPFATSVNIGGEFEAYFSKRVSIRSDISFSIPVSINNKVIAHNHSIFTGFSYHMPFKRLDFLLGIQPGVSVVQSYKEDGNLTFVQPVPVISAIGGCQFYVSRFFHCYVLTRFITGTNYRNAATSLSLTEFRIMFGIGMHINTVRLKRRH